MAHWFGAALDHGGGEPVAGGGVVGVVAGVGAGVQAVLHVGHDPRAVAGAEAPDLDVAEVDGLHGAVAVVVVVGLGVAVVEAAAAVVVRAVEDGVLAFRVVAGGDVLGAVVAVAVAGGDVDAVGLVAVDRDRRRGGVGEAVGAGGGTAGGRVGEVVAVAGLVVDLGDDAGRARAERVLRRGVGDPARAERADVRRGVVRGAPDLVQRPVVGGVQRPGRAVRRHAGRAAGGVDVARLLRRRPRRREAAGANQAPYG